MKVWTDRIFEGQQDLFNLLTMENNRQVQKWGIQTRTPFEWLAYTTEELGELAEAVSEWFYRGGNAKAIIREAVQVATLALKIAEMAQEEVR